MRSGSCAQKHKCVHAYAYSHTDPHPRVMVCIGYALGAWHSLLSLDGQWQLWEASKVHEEHHEEAQAEE